ncbi:uncharacterized protein GGS22DRAFT_190657 [Annulohypoxylon maeteangense]|uniref:uncharacterized protein n=1 Tax=Annulohypoxylon maeteangense TaxID=1927788 RepID=UPI002008E0F5|nr:uncharacterized protein GGS22DRAFT_190657 [Annulohypoxylon maeteangense]KAI0882676.1 hypothetical protein GGS22DRAFT_190657 [Annulohypoxylon maeteangense]
MESLIDIDSPSSKDKHLTNNNKSKPSLDLLLEGSDNDELALRDCPVLTTTTSLTSAPFHSINNGPETTGLPTPLSLPEPDPIHVLRNTVTATDSNTRGSEQAQANFIISQTPEAASGVIEAVHKELSRANGGRGLEIRKAQESAYLRIVAPSKNVAEMISAAQDVADELISNESSRAPGIFQEPPTKVDNACRVVLDVNEESGEVRPKLQQGQGAASSTDVAENFDEYAAKLNDRVCAGLKKAGRLPLSLTLRVHFGNCMLKTYPQGKEVYEYRDFCAMMRNPRASAWLKTSIGNETLAKRVLDFIRNDPRSPFLPTGNQLGSPANVLPEYAFEARSQRTKFDMAIKKRTRGNTRNRASFQSYHITACGVDATFAELDILNQSLGRNLDWKLEAVNEDKSAKTFPEVDKYLRTANIELVNLDRPHDLDVYPRVKLEPINSVAAKIKDVAVKTLYRFRWKETSYTIEVAVNHRWNSIAAMTAESLPTIDVGVSVFGQDWDSEEESAGNIWGDELQHLLEAGNGHVTSTGVQRVDNFIQVIRDIRNTIDPIFQNRSGENGATGY